MIRWEQLASAKVPGGEGELRLMRRGEEFSIFAGPSELMGSRLSGSEEALATMTCARLASRARPRLLIGGLGMGFTLRRAQALLGPGAEIALAELVPEVVLWGRGPLSFLHGESLDDPRLTIFEGDVAVLIKEAAARYDAILLDVDNGPAALMRPGNDDLYDCYGLEEARTALRPGGILAVWSSGPDARFSRNLRTAGFEVEEHRVRANGRDRGPRHVIWLATRRG